MLMKQFSLAHNILLIFSLFTLAILRISHDFYACDKAHSGMKRIAFLADRLCYFFVYYLEGYFGTFDTVQFGP